MSDISSETNNRKYERKKKIDFDEFEEEDEEETKQSKRRKHLGNLILDEAAVDEDDDEEEYEDFDDGDLIDHPDDEAEVQDAIEHLKYDNRRELNNFNFQNDEEIEEYYRNRYEENDVDDFGTGNAMAAAISQQKCLPGVKDPNLWQVPCTRGEEKNSVLTLMNKFIYAQYTNTPLLIKSAFSKDNVQGFIYIEAFKETHVKKAIEDIRHLLRGVNKSKMVSINEMTDVMKVLKSFKKLQPGQWVRVAKGLYKNDLAKVIDVEDAQNLVYVQLVPRIDLKRIKEGQNARSRFVRPNQALISRKRITELGLEYSKNGDKIIFKSNEFDEKGYVYKSFKMPHIISERVNPEMNEIEKFNENPNNINVTSAVKKSIEEMECLLSVGDTVEVCKGFLKELRGKIISVDGKNISVLPLENDLKEPMSFQPDELRKYFTPGNHVKVIQGKCEGETGMVVAYDSQTAVVMSDMGVTQFKVHPRYLQLCSQGATGVTACGNFQIGDMIQIDPQTVGVVVKFEKNKMNVLTTSNKITSLSTSSSLRKKESNKSCGLDAENNEIRPREIVNVIDGHFSGQQGEVKHIYKSFSFIYNRNSTENAGYFAIKNRLLSKKWKGNKQNIDNLRGPTIQIPQSPRLHDVSNNQQNNDKQKFKQPNTLKSEKKFIGSTARIIKGPLKGNIGIIKEIKADTATIELHSMFKTVKVVKENFALINNAGRIIDSHFGATNARPNTISANSGWDGRTPNYGLQTPMYGSATPHYSTLGGETPRHIDSSGGRTPHVGSQTPRQFGQESETPRGAAFDPAGATPAHHSSYDIFDEGVNIINNNLNETPLSALSNSILDSPAVSGIYNPNSSDAEKASQSSTSMFSPIGNIPRTPACSNYNIFTPATPGNEYNTIGSGPSNYYENRKTPKRQNESNLVQIMLEHVQKNVIVLARLNDEELKRGVIQAMNGDIVSLRLPDEKRVISISLTNIYRLEPEAGNTVIFFNGENVEIGQCLSIESEEGVVKIKGEGESLKLCPLKCLEPYNE